MDVRTNVRNDNLTEVVAESMCVTICCAEQENVTYGHDWRSTYVRSSIELMAWELGIHVFNHLIEHIVMAWQIGVWLRYDQLHEFPGAEVKDFECCLPHSAQHRAWGGGEVPGLERHIEHEVKERCRA